MNNTNNQELEFAKPTEAIENTDTPPTGLRKLRLFLRFFFGRIANGFFIQFMIFYVLVPGIIWLFSPTISAQWKDYCYTALSITIIYGYVIGESLIHNYKKFYGKKK